MNPAAIKRNYEVLVPSSVDYKSTEPVEGIIPLMTTGFNAAMIIIFVHCSCLHAVSYITYNFIYPFIMQNELERCSVLRQNYQGTLKPSNESHSCEIILGKQPAVKSVSL